LSWYHLALVGVRIAGYRLRRVEQNSELREKVGGELIAVDQLELARVDGQSVADVEIFHRVELSVGGAWTLHPVTSNDRTYAFMHSQSGFYFKHIPYEVNTTYQFINNWQTAVTTRK